MSIPYNSHLPYNSPISYNGSEATLIDKPAALREFRDRCCPDIQIRGTKL
jgi:hypothetical protein